MRFRESSMSYLPSIWIWLGIITCIALSALFAGLNLAIFSLSQLRLQIEADSGNKDAARVLDLRKNSNQVLATVIWGNVGTNVFMTLLSDSVLAGLGAFLFSAIVITLLGEIAPQAYFLAERSADDGAIFALPDFLARRVVLRGQADSDTARLVARS
jgi:metal transporter CNNM